MNEQIPLFEFDDFKRRREKFWEKLGSTNEADCPCCDRFARISKLSIHSTLAQMLIILYRKSTEQNSLPDGWVHIESFRPAKHASGRDFCITKHWGLAEPKPAGIDENKNSSGMWRLTDKGVAFVERRTTVPRNAYVFDDCVLRFSDEVVSVEQALTEKFNYHSIFGA